MNVIFTCGGTGGHINPAIAVAKLLQARHPDANILFIGAENGMECDLVPREGFALETLKISNLQRSLSPKGICHNLVTAAHIAGSMRKADRIIRAFRPDVIIGTGGYASFPALKQGIRRKIPTAVHESNAVPGLATRLVSGGVSRIMVSFEESRSLYEHPERVIVTGTPVREEFLYLKRAAVREKLGLDDRPLVLSYWGSLGAREMNKKIARFIQLECKQEPFQHIHATGSFGYRWMPDLLREMGVELHAHPSVDLREYIYDMPALMAAADLIICRAGASTISEVAASATPCIMVPSPNVADNHQEKNARVLESRGAAMVLRENECDGDRLFAAAQALLSQPEKTDAMRKALSKMAVLDATERIYRVILELAKAQ
ncbi:MAG: UDP-N-acetylglucosamine--N-acetylmuramyl-(pentapeptide) pyrophosphoryl-undecaprenol N-acetylglucosamine transferase [Oscillospiraceae bacterium]|nr:UDP-N-acetylglucosamine--N-acetylmuramyl-(pentapeptide) pyrophosphoryl-undecaprenol N-acetylglucosamine transferase [Oscillospiraceae bacterium]